MLAECLIEQNKLDEAAKLLDGIDPKSVAQLEGIPDFAPTIALARAEIAFRRGDYAEARNDIETAIPVFSRPDAEPYPKRKLETLLNEIDKHLAHSPK